MRRSVALLTVIVLVVSVVACSSGFFDIGGIEFHLGGSGEFTRPHEQRAIPFTATGRPVDDGVVCDRGTMTIDHFESMDGETITDEDWTGMFDKAMEEEGIAEMYSLQDFECDDGSGGFSLKLHNRFDFATFEFEGEQDVGFWEIEEGAGSYSDLSGSGDVTLDWDNDDIKYEGDVR